MSWYVVDVIVTSAKKKKRMDRKCVVGRGLHLDVIVLFLQYEVQGLPHSGRWDAVFLTETMC